MSALVAACLAEAVVPLAPHTAGGALAPALEPHLRAARAWVATALDCVAVESFSFEPGADPAWAW